MQHTERPILFSAPMVRAILDGEKTQTRRVVKIRPFLSRYSGGDTTPRPSTGRLIYRDGGAWDDHPRCTKPIALCPYGQPGDRLWVRETFTRLWFDQERDWQTFYRADNNLDYVSEAAAGLWKPSIHMPRAYSRISLEVVGVRVERVQDISEAGIKAEGFERAHYRGYTKQKIDDPADLCDAWDAMNAGRGYPWESNPWVWVVEFKRIVEEADTCGTQQQA